MKLDWREAFCRPQRKGGPIWGDLVRLGEIRGHPTKIIRVQSAVEGKTF